ncbi:MAG TPA: alkaline phosphatase family protein [Gemmatimonadaceae bacterium]|nr:alkaline phosphatase family protein [Gemmatimonadaceae bacterium]
MQKPTLVFATLSLALAACAPSPTAGTATHAALTQRVVLVSIDGLRGDAMAAMPNLAALRDRGLWTDSMRTVLPALTVPGHLSMLTGRDVTALGITSNTLDAGYAVSMVVNGASTVFDWVRGAGGTSIAVAGAALVPAEKRADAQRLFGVDTLIAASVLEDSVRAQAVALEQGPRQPTLLFVHFSGADLAGHDSGWIVPGARAAAGGDSLAPAYLAAARHVDGAVGGIWSAIAADVEAGRAALIVTADHGGGHGDHCPATPDAPAFREHCTAASGDQLIPFVLVAKGVAHAKLPRSARITQVGPTIASLLDIWLPRAADRPVAY